MRANDRSKRLEVVCGGETGLLDPALFGPGGGSRCIQFGEHLITPIEFEALSGKKSRNWKFNLRVDGKPIKALFESNILTTCEKNCSCTNCLIGKKYPTDLELLIEKVYLNKTFDLSIVKKEKEEPKKGKMLEKPEDACDLKDEIFSSPETTPKKKQKKRSSMETPVDEILPVENNSPTTSEQSRTSPEKAKEVTSPIHVVTSHPDPESVAPILDKEELTPAKRQKDIRSFFGKSPSSKIANGPKSPGAKSDSSVELIAEGRPRRHVQEVDLTENQDINKTPKKRGPGRPPRSASAASGSVDKEKPEDLLAILRQEKKRALSPRRRLPRDAKTATSEEKETKSSPTKSVINSNGVGKRKVNSHEDETGVKKKKVTKEDSKVTEDTPKVSEKLKRKTPKSETEEKPMTNGKLESPVKLEPDADCPVSPVPSPSKVPTYTTMVRAALEDMNCVGGEGCTKLEILLYILRKFKPKGNVEQVTTKLIQVLETGTKRGDFLSSVSCPRVLKKENKEVKKESDIKTEPKENGIKKEKGKPGPKPKKKEDQKSLKKGIAGKKPADKVKGNTESKKNPVNNQPVVKKLLEPLSTICKAKKLTRQETLRKVKAYIKLRKLQDTKDKNVIICDDQIKKMTKCKKIPQSALMAHIKPFMVPILKKK